MLRGFPLESKQEKKLTSTISLRVVSNTGEKLGRRRNTRVARDTCISPAANITKIVVTNQSGVSIN